MSEEHSARQKLLDATELMYKRAGWDGVKSLVSAMQQVGSISRQTVYNLFKIDELPTMKTLDLFLTVCSDRARSRLPELDPRYHKRQWWSELRDAAAEEMRRPRVTRSARCIGSWTAADLGVHPALTLDDIRLPALPAYLRRSVDDDLDKALSAAAADGGLVVLTGESSIGKTRALFDAVSRHPEVSVWPVHFPRTAGSLVDLLMSDQLAVRAVLWLDEAQHHLGEGKGEQAAAMLRELFDGSRPGRVVALATMWPTHWDWA